MQSTNFSCDLCETEIKFNIVYQIFSMVVTKMLVSWSVRCLSISVEHKRCTLIINDFRPNSDLFLTELFKILFR